MQIFRFITTVVAAVMLNVAVYAQMKIIPQEKIRDVSAPRLSADSASFVFLTKHIIADPMDVDDEPEVFRFAFTNVSGETVGIKRLVTSCSCLTAMCDVRNIAPGASSEIVVRYDPEGHSGKFERKVFVYTGDGNSPAAVLRLSVDVASGSDLSADWPVQIGTIRLRRSAVTFSGESRAVETLRFINVGGSPLELQCETLFLPDCLSFRVEPSVVDPGQEGMIDVCYDPSAGTVMKKMKIILKGLGLPPSQSVLTVLVDDVPCR